MKIGWLFACSTHDELVGGGSGAVGDLLVEALLNHRPPVLVRTYQVADRWEDKRAAWDTWSRDLAALVG